MFNKKIRLATAEDAESILKIYAPFIKDTVITFEYDVPSAEDFENRIKTISYKYPYLVCEIENIIVGYAYANSYNERQAYDWSVDFSIYVEPSFQRKKIATALYVSLIETLRMQGFYNAFALITKPNEKSENFHKAFGFQSVGIHCKAGYKFHKWYDVEWMELNLNKCIEKPCKPIIMSEIENLKEFRQILQKGEKIIRL